MSDAKYFASDINIDILNLMKEVPLQGDLGGNYSTRFAPSPISAI